MIYRISDISLPLDGTLEDLREQAAVRLGVSIDAVHGLKLYKKSIDARKKNEVHFICTVEVECAQNNRPKDSKIAPSKPYHYDIPVCKPMETRPIVVGLGPGGLFAALLLAQAGQRPIVFERGADVTARTAAVQAFWRTGKLDPNCNVQFGEGGAGAFSDGKLTTGTKDVRVRKVLEEFVKHGAPPEILIDAKPHIGTDKLPKTVQQIREEICKLGGEVHFSTAVTKIHLKNGKVNAVEVTPHNDAPYSIETRAVILAVGHSARDTFEMLLNLKIPMQPKAFSVGARMEHLQKDINRAQYGNFAEHPALGAADYKLAVHLKNGRGVYTFCMCPGGQVVAAASEEHRLVTNGMSNYARNGKNANAALLVGVTPEDFGDDSPLAGVAFQRHLEEAAYQLGGGAYRAPAQRLEDFLKNRPSKGFGDVTPTYCPGVTPSNLADCLPEVITDSMREGISQMERYLRGFTNPDAVLTGVESRSSSPVRILRGDTGQSLGAEGLYPCGEGAGYAGGIVSAAVDGLRCAEYLLHQYAADV